MVVNPGWVLLAFLGVALASVVIAWFVAMRARADAEQARQVAAAALQVIGLLREQRDRANTVAGQWQAYAETLRGGAR